MTSGMILSLIHPDVSDEEYISSIHDEQDTLSDILQAAGIPYSDVDFSDFNSDIGHHDHDNVSIDSNSDEEIAVDDAYIDHDSADLEITSKGAT